MRSALRTLACTPLLAALGCGDSKETTAWSSESCELTTVPTLTLASEPSPEWHSCRATYFAEVSNIPASLSLQLMSNGNGSFIDPAPGWLTITMTNVDSLSGQVNLSSTFPGNEPGVLMTYRWVSKSGSRIIWPGTISIAGMQIEPHGDGNKDSNFNLSMQVAAATADGAVKLSGGVAVQSSRPEPPPGESPSGGSSSGDCSSSCQGLVNRCASNPNSQAPCYCAAACACRYCGDPSCESQNRKSAASLGTTCSY